MPWDRTRPGTQAKYRTPEHRAERARLERQMRADGYLICAQPECVMETRTIGKGEPWHTGHNDAGDAYIGAVHPKCNVRAAALAANRRGRAARERHWSL